MKQKRLKPSVRRDEILKASCVLAGGLTTYDKLTRDKIAKQVGVSPTAVQYHFKTMTQLRRQIVRYAITNEVVHVVAQAMVTRDPHLVGVGSELKNRAAKYLMSAL